MENKKLNNVALKVYNLKMERAAILSQPKSFLKDKDFKKAEKIEREIQKVKKEYYASLENEK